MNKKVIYALLLIALTVIVAIASGRGSTDIWLVRTISVARVYAYLAFAAVGIVIGLLLK